MSPRFVKLQENWYVNTNLIKEVTMGKEDEKFKVTVYFDGMDDSSYSFFDSKGKAETFIEMIINAD